MIDMVQPASARVLVTELSGSGQINPTPAEKACEDTKTALELCLSPEKLVNLQQIMFFFFFNGDVTYLKGITDPNKYT